MSVAAADPENAAAFRSRKRLAAPCRPAAVHFSDDFCLLRQRAGQREAVGQHVVLTISVGRIREDADADVADDADRLRGFSGEKGDEEIRRVQAESAFVRRVRQLGRETQRESRPPPRLRHHSNLRGDDEILDVVRGIPGDSDE